MDLLNRSFAVSFGLDQVDLLSEKEAVHFLYLAVTMMYSLKSKKQLSKTVAQTNSRKSSLSVSMFL
jgi:hypothetical protein